MRAWPSAWKSSLHGDKEKEEKQLLDERTQGMHDSAVRHKLCAAHIHLRTGAGIQLQRGCKMCRQVIQATAHTQGAGAAVLVVLLVAMLSGKLDTAKECSLMTGSECNDMR